MQYKQEDTLEVSFTFDTTVYYIPILRSGLAVRHVALLIRESFKLFDDIVICKPLTRTPFHGSAILVPGRAVTVHRACTPTTYVPMPIPVTTTASSTAVAVPGGSGGPGGLGDAEDVEGLALAPAATAVELVLRFDAVVHPTLRCGVAAFCVYLPALSACRVSIMSTERPTVHVRCYKSGPAAVNAAAAELQAVTDALTHCLEDPMFAKGETSIKVVCESTYVIQAANSVVSNFSTFCGRNAACMTRLKDLCAKPRAVTAQWACTRNQDYNRPSITALRRHAVASMRNAF